MKNMNFDEFLAEREKAASAYVRGDGSKVDEIVPHQGDASFHSPTGDTVTGANEVAERYLKDARAFHEDGTSHFDVLQKGNGDGIAFWTGFQLAKCQIGDMPKPVDMKIRVTEIFHKIDGAWKMIHRHADSPKSHS